ncbi:MAG TPA: hypothetical protein PKW10_12190 [Saprospiraceae bacterium]|nr:hypothetical protein [Saprospiraceae bacterium]
MRRWIAMLIVFSSEQHARASIPHDGLAILARWYVILWEAPT